MSFPKLTALAAVALAIACPSVAGAATYPPGFEERTIVGGLSRPTTVAWAPDGRMFVVEKDGVLKVVAPGATTAAVMADWRTRVSDYDDRGLTGLAVDSQFDQYPYLYLAYTRDIAPLTPDNKSPAVAQLVRLRINAASEITEETVILGTYADEPCPAAANTLDCIPADGGSHTIGTVRSASDGTLWVGTGDAIDDGGTDLRSLRTYDEASLAGKLLHINRDGQGLASNPFCPGNPVLTHVCTKLYAKGFRNPFRFALRPGGGITVGDVGWASREEINLINEGGSNYGWPCWEGTIRTPGYRDLTQCQAQYNPGATVPPTYEYPHGGSLSVLGGPTYTGSAYPAGYAGSIFFGDYSGRFLRRLLPNGAGGYSEAPFAEDWTGTTIEVAPDLNLAYVSVGDFGNGSGSVQKIVYSPGNNTPIARIQASPTSGPAPLSVNFNGIGSTDPDGDPLTYSWNFGDGTTSTVANPSHTYAAGNYTAQLTVNDDGGLSSTATQQISSGNTAPAITFGGDSTYRGGEVFTVTGAATDAEDGPLPLSALEWNVRLIHIEHAHSAGNYSGVAQVDIEAGTDHDADSYYEVQLNATDSAGLTTQRILTVNPETTTVRLRSEPSGALVSYGGVEIVTPRDLTTTIGYVTTLSVPASFEQNGQIFDFVRWSDSGARAHGFTVPPQGGTLTATFRGQASPIGPSAGPGDSPGGPGGGGQSPSADRAGPTLRLTGASAQSGRLRGRALDPSGVRRVQVALRNRRTDAGCNWWLPRLEGLSLSRRSCERPRLIAAELTATSQGVRWRANLGGPVPPGRYRAFVQAYDNAGNRSRLAWGPSTLVRVER